jgi:hypothetical protein
MSNQIKFYPLHAINEFMRPDFRLSIIRDVLNNVDSLSSDQVSALGNFTKKAIKIPGFRNSEKAPVMVKVMPITKGFEKNPELVGVILSAWAAIHKELAIQVYTLLKMRNWPVLSTEGGESFNALSSDIVDKWPLLPLTTNRTQAPGFFPRWPKGEDFEKLYNTFLEVYPEGDSSIDQVSLMAVWLTLRLPYEIEDITL